MRKEFEDHIDKNFSFLQGKKLLLACSGGVDSLVLTNLFKRMDCEIALAHCNFSLRGKESDGDEMFVVGLANKLEVAVFAETFDTKAYAKANGISTQMAARELRYEWFSEILVNFKYDYLLTAHHLDDDLETFFINLSRGTGIHGLLGIPAINGKIIRPLLPFSREQIMDFAKNENLKWREDSSNQKADYLRNKLRLELIPKFKEANDSVLKNFKKTQHNLQSSKNLIEDYMALIYNLAVKEEKDYYRINIQKIKELPNTNALLYELLHGFGFTEWDDVSSLLSAQSGKQLFSKTHRLIKNREELLLANIAFNNFPTEFTLSADGIEFPIKLKIESAEYIGETIKNLIYVDSAKLKFPLIIRKWKEGDIFHPFGLKGKKKLSKFFKDEKLSIMEKEDVWLLLSGEEIVWVIGYRMEDKFRVTEETQRIFKIIWKD